MEDLVVGALIGLGTWAALRSLFRGTSAPPQVEDGALVLRYPRAFDGIGIGILVLMAAFLGWMVVELGVRTLGEALAVLALALFGGGTGAVFLVAARREWVRITPMGLEAQTVLSRAPTHISWGEVESVRFGRVSGYLTLRTRDGRTVRVSAFLTGVLDFAGLVERHLASCGGPEAARQLRAFQANYSG